MSDLLVEANEAVRAARQEGATALARAAIEGFVARYWGPSGPASPTIAPCRRSSAAREDGPSVDPGTTSSSG